MHWEKDTVRLWSNYSTTWLGIWFFHFWRSNFLDIKHVPSYLTVLRIIWIFLTHDPQSTVIQKFRRHNSPQGLFPQMPLRHNHACLSNHSNDWGCFKNVIHNIHHSCNHPRIQPLNNIRDRNRTRTLPVSHFLSGHIHLLIIQHTLYPRDIRTLCKS